MGIHCDKCKEDIKDDMVKFNASFDSFSDVKKPTLCKICTKKFNRLVKNWLKE